MECIEGPPNNLWSLWGLQKGRGFRGWRIHEGTIGEDMELIIKLHEHMIKNIRKYNVKFIPGPVCWTQVPETLKDLRNQRRRWQIGLMDSLLRHKKMFLNPKYGMVGMAATPYFWIFEMLGPIVEITGYILVPFSYVFGLLNLKFLILFLTSSILYGIIENFGYRQLTTLYRLEGLIRFKKYRHRWGEIKRKRFKNSK